MQVEKASKAVVSALGGAAASVAPTGRCSAAYMMRPVLRAYSEPSWRLKWHWQPYCLSIDGLGNSRSFTLLCPRLVRPALLGDPPRVGAEVVAIRAPGYCRAQNLHVVSRDACAGSP